ncbi:hypothetical protein LCGC14_0303460 [marine sediment metagenome]|uniref:Uncharacterized protein n=1 Tax=marine sediment metagenome TaxID=412755 RepID=A0A0F9TPT4_9ZZZZ
MVAHKKTTPSIKKGIRYFSTSPTWWVSLILLALWFLIPEYSGIKPVMNQMFGDGGVGNVLYYSVGLIVSVAVFFFGVGVKEHNG